MAQTLTYPDRPIRRATLTASRLWNILWESAWEALITALLALVLGQVAVGMVSGLWQGMTPSRPPLLGETPTAEATPSPALDGIRQALIEHRFAILFGLIFAATVAGRLIRYSKNPRQRQAGVWLRRISRRISNEWFGLIVVNAFVAMVTAVVIQWTEGFVFSKFMWNLLWNALRPLTQGLAAHLPGAGLWQGLVSLFSWYGDNQFKFTFWLIYAAAICDDLGLPNFKTLARWLWRRISPQASSATGASRTPIAT